MTERSLTAAQRADLEAASSSNALLVFLTIRHRRLPEPLRVVSDVFDYAIGGETYISMPFEMRLLNDDEQLPGLELIAPNIDRRLGLAFERVREPAVVDLTVYSSADFDLTQDPRPLSGGATPLYDVARFQVTSADITAAQVRTRVALYDYTVEEWPGIRATQNRFPGLFV